MDILFNAAGGLIVVVVKYTVLPIKRHVCYFFNHKRKVKSLNDQLEKLKDKKQSLQHSADSAIRNGRQIVQAVEKWLTDVDKQIRKDEAELRKYEDEAKKRCFIPFCPHFMSRYHLSRKAEEEADLVDKLLTNADQFRTNEIAFDPDPQLMGATSQEGLETFKSREDVVQKILKALKDPNIQKIGVYGMGGVGKTMLVKQIDAIAKKDKLFDEVAIATISNSQKTDIKKVQGEIADVLGLKFDQETESGRANKLRKRLNNGRKILVILDDLWEKVDLEAAGIIFEKNQNKVGLEADGIKFERNQTMTNVGCKILLTSRNSDTVCIRMHIETIFQVTSLSPEDSMAFFTKIVGSKVEKPDYKQVTIGLVAKCAGLPVAISAVANALKEKDIDIWKNALQQLKRANPAPIEGLHKDVYSSLELSYQYLRSQEAKSLLLLCGLEPQAWLITVTDLIKYSWGLDLLEKVDTLEDAGRNVGALIHELKSSTLLLGGDDDTAVQMHDIVRDVTISIADKDNQMFVIENQVQMENMLRRGKLENCTALSLPFSDIHELPPVLHCAELKFFLWYNKARSTKIPDAFFKETNKLSALGLTSLEFSTLPSSFRFLTNLRTLCLDDCILQDIAIIGELKQLEVLSFIKSKN